MWHISIFLTLFPHSGFGQDNDLLEECAKFYKPKNYLEFLPNMGLPYMDQIIMPDNLKHHPLMKNIDPTPTMTKVLAVKTKYVYMNPICVKFTKKQKLCQPEDGRIRENVDYDKLITKQHFIENNIEKRVESMMDILTEESEFEPEKFNMKVSFDKLEPSESYDSDESRAYKYPNKHRTPTISPQKIHQMLIEDRLDQLETILPQYHRRRIFETSTIYVTKTISNRRNMATLVVKNCIPVGYDICANKRKNKYRNRLSKVAKNTTDSDESKYYFG